ncbi:MAG: bifunctional heptose 7-phosphate kinase/heptose 1-phosphate adenyltransferase, partial [Alphaproteobacteria bacterium]|nr:bifunctional heptose 7-phosphate kinase/heptose 1-phosphate adenyltransferase [Alphaproteobacteria bacterium]
MNQTPRLIEWLDRLSDAHVLCVGDVMLDRFVYGDVDRISPEAPIPVLHIKREALAVGGAGNVARNLSALGAGVRLFGVIGDDGAGSATAGVLEGDATVKTDLITDPARPTTVKTRFIAGVQQMLRTDEEDLSPIARDVLDEMLRGVT